MNPDKRQSLFRLLFSFSVTALLFSQAIGQGWVRSFPEVGFSGPNVIAMEHSSGHIWVAGNYIWDGTLPGNNTFNSQLYMLDQDGEILWQKFSNEVVFGLVENNNGDIIMVTSNIIDLPQVYILDAITGDTLSSPSNTFDGPDFYTTGKLSPQQDHFLLVMERQGGNGPNPASNHYADVYHLDHNGNILDSGEVDINNSVANFDIDTIENGFLLSDGSIRRVDGLSNQIWQSGWAQDIDGGILNSENQAIYGLGFGEEGNSLSKFDTTGNLLWEKPVPGNLYLVGSAKCIKQLPDGNLVYASHSDGQLLLCKLDTSANVIWTVQHEVTSPGLVGPQELLLLSDGGFLITGSVIHPMTVNGAFTFNASSSFAIRTDSNGQALGSKIQGRVFYDLNENCLYDPGEMLLHGINIQTSSEVFSMRESDENGEYCVQVDTGNYQISVVPPSVVWEPCSPVYDVFLGWYDTTTLDLPLQAIVSSPVLEVNVSIPFLRRCFENHYTITYQNNGTAEATDSYVEVTLDSFLVFVDASIPVTSVDGFTYSFFIGDLPVGANGSFQITVIPDCDSTVLGQTHCVEAHIYPDSIPDVPGAIWEGGIIDVDGNCVDDEVVFTITNIGPGDMDGPLDYVVIEDAVLLTSGSFNLLQGQNVQIPFPANGSTYWLKAQQVPGAPASSLPGFVVEGCGSLFGGGFSTGFVNDFPIEDYPSFEDINCIENIGAYDPNRKLAFPEGYEDDHKIEPGAEIEYQIDFQNTGTDTAFRVILIDTLSVHLDQENLEILGASHDFEWKLKQNRILEFRFDDILLPDSTTNEPASHGWAKFRIKPKVETALGTVIRNNADIYFDFNEPIRTNETFHTLHLNIITFVVDINQPGVPDNQILIYPNPFSESAIIEIKGDVRYPVNFSLIDQTGKHVYRLKSSDQSFTIQPKNLSGGIYFYLVSDEEGRRLQSGKVIVH